jgi:pyruvate dehydrogenase E1 component
MNENYPHPELPEGSEEGIVRGMYRLRGADKPGRRHVRLLGSGTILREVIAAADLLSEHGVTSEVWSVTSFNELARDGMDVTRWNLLHPGEEKRLAYVSQQLEDGDAPVVAATDYIKVFADQIRAYVPGDYRVLGTDGFGRSDTREQLRHFFEVDRRYVTIAALSSLADRQVVSAADVKSAMKKLDIDPKKANPRLV